LRVDIPLDIKPGELRCPHCFSRDLVPSKPRGIWDALMQVCGRIPRHCRRCGQRFHPRVEQVRVDAELRAETEKDSGETGPSKTGF
jgi:DNA-directed RNA polymerase subunit RPC12/RpoP